MSIAEKIEELIENEAPIEARFAVLATFTAQLARSVEAYPAPKSDYVTRDKYEKALKEFQREAFAALVIVAVHGTLDEARHELRDCLERLLKEGSE